MPGFRPLPRTSRAPIAIIGITILVFGASFGVLARDVGMSTLQATVMSFFVMAGASQFAAIGALSAGASMLTAGLAATALALRYLPLGIAASNVLEGRSPLQRIIDVHLLTDPGVVIGGQPSGTVHGPSYRWTGTVMIVTWTLGTGLAAWLAPRLPAPQVLGLDAAYPALFLALLAEDLRNDRRARRAAVAGGTLAAVGLPFLPAGLPMVVGALGAGAAAIGTRGTSEEQGGEP